MAPPKRLAAFGAALLVASGIVVVTTSAPAAADGTVVLRPDSDVVRQWTSGTAGAAWAALDDAVLQPVSVSAADYIYASVAGARTEVTLQTTPLSNGSAALTGWFYANTGSATQLTAALVTGTKTLASVTVPAGSGFAWRSLSVSGVTQGDLDDARLRFTSVGGGDSNVRAAYASAAVTPGSACTPTWGNFGPGAWPAGCWRPFPDTSPFNTKIPANARVMGNSAAIVGRVLGDISARDYVGHITADPQGHGGEPTYYAKQTDPTYTIDCIEYGGDCTIDGMVIRIPAVAAPEGGWNSSQTADRHLTIVDQASGWSYDMWRVQGTRLPDPGGVLTIYFGGRSRIFADCAPGVPADGTNCEADGIGHGTAAHFAGLAGRVRIEELEAGRIDHALNIVIDCDNGQFVYPARNNGQECAEPANAPPMGALLHLNMSRDDIDDLPIQEWKKVFLRAMAEYGMYFGDTGSRNIFSIEVESGNQYSRYGHTDPWYAYGQANWEEWVDGGVTSYVAKLYARPDDDDPTLDWNTEIWSNLRVLDPCVAQRTC